MDNALRIRRLATHKLEENLRFENYLLQSGIPPERIDRAVHHIHRQVASTVDCTACARCCLTIQPGLNEEDIQRLSLSTKIPAEELKQRLLKPWEDPGEWTFQRVPCPMLKGRLCAHYESRPVDCQSYPHLHRPGFLKRVHAVIGNTFICPIAYHVLEQLKKELGFTGVKDKSPRHKHPPTVRHGQLSRTGC